MDTLDNDFNVQEETRQMKKLQMYQKLVLFTLFKYKLSIMIVFMLTVIIGIVCRYVQFKYSHHKHEGSVTLFYTPRASEEVKPLSLNHVLGVFARQQIFKQLIDELHLNEKQRTILKQSIEVKLLRDHNDMFVITGIGDSDEYVKLLVNTFVSLGIRNYEEYRTAELRNFLESRERRLLELQNFQNTQIEKIHALHRKYGIIHPIEEMETVKRIQGEQSATLAELNVKLANAGQRFAIAKKNYDELPLNVIKHRAALREFMLNLRKTSREYEKAKLMFAERNPRLVEAKAAHEAIFNEFESFFHYRKQLKKIINSKPRCVILIPAGKYADLNISLANFESLIREEAEMLRDNIVPFAFILSKEDTGNKKVTQFNAAIEELCNLRSFHLVSDGSDIKKLFFLIPNQNY